MNFVVNTSDNVDEKEWNQKLLKSIASTTYQITNWATVYEFFRSKPVFITVRDATGEISGQLLLLIHDEMLWADSNLFVRFVGTKFHLQTALTWFYGPIIHDEHHSDEILLKILQALNDVSIKNKVTIVRGSSHPSSERLSSQIFKKFGYQLQPWATYITDLKQNEDDLYESLDKKTRYDIRKSEQNELDFVVANDRADLDEFIELKTEEKMKVGRKIRNVPGFYDNRWEYLHKNEYEKLFLVRYKGRTIAGILNIIFNGNVVQHGVSTPSKKQLLGGPFLTWNTIKWCMNRKYSTYDMGGINPEPKNDKEKSMNFYKSKWGGKKLDYLRFTKILDNNRWKFSAAIKDPKKIKKILH